MAILEWLNLLNLLLRFPVKRLSNTKQEPQEKKLKKPFQEIPFQRARGRREMKQKDEEELEEEDKEEVLSQSLQKRDKNIKENKAMVMNLHNILSSVLLFCKTSFDSRPVVVFQLAKLFADLSTMADLPLPTTPQVSVHTIIGFFK